MMQVDNNPRSEECKKKESTAELIDWLARVTGNTTDKQGQEPNSDS
jgi:hypothetical protein